MGGKSSLPRVTKLDFAVHPVLKEQCQEEGYQSYQGSETQTLTGHHVMVTYDN